MRDDEYPRTVSDPESEGLPGTADDDSTAYDDVRTGRQADGPDPAALPADHPVAVDRYGTTAAEQLHGASLDERLAWEEPDAGATGVTGTAAGPGTPGDTGDQSFAGDDDASRARAVRTADGEQVPAGTATDAGPGRGGGDDPPTGTATPFDDTPLGTDVPDPVLDDWSQTDDRTVEDGADPDPDGERVGDPERGRRLADDVAGPDPAPELDSEVSGYDRDDTAEGAGAHTGRLVQPDAGGPSDREPDAIATDAGAAGGGASAEELAMHETPPPSS